MDFLRKIGIWPDVFSKQTHDNTSLFSREFNSLTIGDVCFWKKRLDMRTNADFAKTQREVTHPPHAIRSIILEPTPPPPGGVSSQTTWQRLSSGPEISVRNTSHGRRRFACLPPRGGGGEACLANPRGHLRKSALNGHGGGVWG